MINGGKTHLSGVNGIQYPPPINIKIINNGNEYPLENTQQKEQEYLIDNNTANFNPPIQNEVVNMDVKPPIESSSGKLDFDKLVVKKILEN